MELASLSISFFEKKQNFHNLWRKIVWNN